MAEERSIQVVTRNIQRTVPWDILTGQEDLEDRAVLARVEGYLDLAPETLDGKVVTRTEAGYLIREEAVFG